MPTSSIPLDETAAATTPVVSSTTQNLTADARYHFDPDALQALRTEAAWMKDPKFFTKVALAPSAVMKILMHCQSGVEKGIAKGGNPVEVMGMLLGRPDPQTPHTLIVTDAFPLPIEGFETRVVADDENVTNHMISLGEALETTRKEKFMGWYHSHPFELGEHSHCFLSQTDLTTQLQWQRAEDPHGNPFVAIVVDPLRSAHTEQPELKAFRAYPPEYNSPVTNECPNGDVEPSERIRLEQWGSCWNRYYELEVEYFMSSTSRHVIVEGLTQDSLWMRTLARPPMSVSDQALKNCAREFQAVGPAATKSLLRAEGTMAVGGIGSSAHDPSVAASTNRPGTDSGRSRELNKAVQQLTALAVEQLSQSTLQQTKELVFGCSGR